jgi:hypothetical protein
MDHQPGPGVAGSITTDRQSASKASNARDDERAPEPATVTWARTQLRERIQQAGAAPTPTVQPAGGQTREIDRSPLADREAEP